MQLVHRPLPASDSPLCTWESCSYQGEARWGCTQMVKLILVLDEPRYRQIHRERGAVLLPPAVGHVEFCVRAGRLHDCCLHRGTATREPWMVGTDSSSPYCSFCQCGSCGHTSAGVKQFSKNSPLTLVVRPMSTLHSKDHGGTHSSLLGGPSGPNEGDHPPEGIRLS